MLCWITPLPSVSKRLVNLKDENHEKSSQRGFDHYCQTIRLHASVLHEGIELQQFVQARVRTFLW